MNRSILLLFLCVFALSELLLAARKVRVRDVSGMKNSRGLRRARSVSCHPMDEKCDKMCKDAGANEGDGFGFRNHESPCVLQMHGPKQE
ncbi:hypothetical protein DdX_17541 [Ditylenchus destructor]|uniref:Uncharacterized protein n=1 Tax=Ditylenchus destructor TaxID=166010 RepID=A0AAD4MMD1_9BILA|nr:hypothetical protein DdX_17541 [Ditylenchus destructor]